METLPVSVMQRMPDKSRRIADEHPVHRVLHDMANPEMTAATWKEVAMTHVVTWGNTYSLKVRDGMGRLRELWPLATDRMEVDRVAQPYVTSSADPITGEVIARSFAAGDLRYRYTRSNGQHVDMTRPDIFHQPGLSWDGIKGYSVIHNARETIGLGLATEEHGARFFGNGATTSFILGTDGKLSDAAHTHLEKQLKEEKAGLSNAWQPWVLEEGLKPLSISMPNDDAQWLETRKHQVTDIARWLRIPPHMLADLERATFTNIEHQALEFIKYSLLPWIVRFEQAMGLQLLGPDWTGRGGSYYIKFNLGALERADMKSRFDSYAVGRQWGFMNGDQIADLEDWDHFPGGEEYIRPLNMTTVNPDGSITQTTMGPARPASAPESEPAGATA
jgi:HK97 family phage portal protein